LNSGTVLSTTHGVRVDSVMVVDELLFERSEIVFHLPATPNGAGG